jgi:K+-sensing histidine kinase KdpD
MVANESTAEFLDVAAHELRTWVTIIYGGVTLLKTRLDAMDEQSRLDLIADIEVASERLRQTVDGMLLLARLQAGRGPVAGPLLLGEALPRIADAFSRERPSRRVSLEVGDLDAVVAVPSYVEYVLRAVLADIDQVAPVEAPISLRAAHESDQKALVSVLAPVKREPQTELLVDEYGGLEEGAHGRHAGPLVARRLVEAQSGRMDARLLPDEVLEVSFTLPVHKE